MLSPKTIKLDQRWDQRWDTPSQRPRPHTDLLGFGRFLLLPFCWPSKPSYEWYSGSVMVSVAHCGISDWSLVVTVGWQVWQAALMRSVTPVPLQTEQAHADNPCRHRPPNGGQRLLMDTRRIFSMPEHDAHGTTLGGTAVSKTLRPPTLCMKHPQPQ